MNIPSFDISLSSLLHPVSVDEFLGDIWEKRTLHVPSNNPSSVEGFFTLQDVDDYLLTQRASLGDAVAIAAHGPDRSEGFYPKTIEEVYEAFSSGASVILRNVDVTWPALAKACAQLSKDLSCRVWANLYLTQEGTQALGAHYDDTDVLVLQLQGKKDWKLYRPWAELPEIEHGSRISQRSISGQMERVMSDADLEDEVMLSPGDVLYMPRGVPHAAAGSGGLSIHVTFAVEVIRWADVLRRELARLTGDDIAFRKALPPGWLDEKDPNAGLEAAFQGLLDRISDQANLKDALEEMRGDVISKQTRESDGHFATLTDLSALGPDTVLERRGKLLCQVHANDMHAVMCFLDHKVRGPRAIEPALRYVARTHRFTVNELPGLTANSQVVLARRLLASGLLTFATP